MLRSVFILLMVLVSSAATAAAASDLARGTAVLDPLALRELDAGRLGLGEMMAAPGTTASRPFTSDLLFALPSMRAVRSSLEADHARYLSSHRAAFPSDTIGSGGSFDLQPFDLTLLFSSETRFYLSGIVNRMDRAHVAPGSCGEVRLIYRLTRLKPPPVRPGEQVSASPRLPMTLNVVLHARNDGGAHHPACAEIARRWLDLADLSLTGADLARQLGAPGGVIDLVRPDLIDRIETNLQVAYLPRSPVRAFRTDYLLKVFRRDAATGAFVESVMENQIDRDRLLADAGLAREFRDWLLDPAHLAELDRGTIIIPERFLAASAIAATPGGSDPQAASRLLGRDGRAVLDERDVVEALARADAGSVRLQAVRSVAGFERRLNEATCSGCHQTRGIGGFHFPGVDWLTANPSNEAVVPASPHFFGEQIRRRDILAAIRDGRPADYSRGFVSRPQTRGTDELAGTSYLDGWGAQCYRARAGADADASFTSWSCAAGLSCQAVDPATRIGMCFVESRRGRDGVGPSD